MRATIVYDEYARQRRGTECATKFCVKILCTKIYNTQSDTHAREQTTRNLQHRQTHTKFVTHTHRRSLTSDNVLAAIFRVVV